MGIMDGINIAEGAMRVHSFRSQIAAENIANIHTAGYKRQVVDLDSHAFGESLQRARAGGAGGSSNGAMDASDGAVRISGVREVSAGPDGERQDQLLATTDMLQAKSAYELNVRAATLLKGMETSALEIGRGG